MTAHTYKYIRHLGKSSQPEDHDQRLAKGSDGHFYLFDWSGKSPDTTDDGPLRIDFTKYSVVSTDEVAVPVKDSRGRSYHVGVTLDGALVLANILDDHGRALPLYCEPEVHTIASLFRLRHAGPTN